MLIKFPKLIFFIFYFKCSNSFDIKHNSTKLQYRLSNNTTPLSYNIHLTTEIDKNDFKFNGICTIKLIVNKNDTKQIEIHAKQKTKLLKIILKNIPQNVEKNILSTNYNNITEIFQIYLDENLNLNELYELYIEYHSVLREDEMGFYRSSYLNDNGEKVWLAATQLAPTEARHAFPCYDEPRFKTIFNIKITHSSDRQAISNTDPIDSIKNLDGTTTTTTFKTTPIMSTYLIGIIISNFDKKISNNHEIYARPNALKFINYAREYGENSYNKLVDIFPNITQPEEINKIKQIAVPDFHFSGMENWGIIMYKEIILFFKDQLYGGKIKLDLCYVMSHEMAHQWFGNLVTHEWWTYVWLKEGFATMYGYYIIDMIYPNWKIMERYQINVMHLVYQIDSDSTIRPMTYYIDNQKDIKKNYDKIAYEKSSCVLRMFDHALDKKKGIFKNGVDFYLNERKLKTANEKHLFNALDKAILESNYDLNITESLGTWTSQGGYPVLNVKCNNSDIYLSQKRFLYVNINDYSLWHIPINFDVENGNNFQDTSAKLWMKNRTENFTINDHNIKWSCENNWIIFNVQQTGYYRVNYDIKNWQLLIKALMNDHETIHTLNRAQLIDDAFNLAKMNQLSYTILFELLQYLSDEREYSPWAAFDNGIELLKVKLMNTKYENNFLMFMQKILQLPFKYFGVVNVVNEIPLVSMTRQIIAKHACDFKLQECFENKLKYNKLDMRPIYYSEKLKTKNKNVLLEVLGLLKKSNDMFVRIDYISSLGYYEDTNILTLLLWRTVEDITLKKLEKTLLFQSVYKNSKLGLMLTCKFILDNWKNVKKSLTNDGFDGTIVDLSKYIQSNDEIEIFNKLLGVIEISDNSVSLATRTVIKSMEWNLFHLDIVTEWLNEHYKINNNDGNIPSECQSNRKFSILLLVMINFLFFF